MRVGVEPTMHAVRASPISCLCSLYALNYGTEFMELTFGKDSTIHVSRHEEPTKKF